MKVHKAVTYSSLVIILLGAVLFGSLPFRFPKSNISWWPIVAFSMPAIALTVFLFIKPLLLLRTFRVLLVVAAILSVGAALFGWLAPIIVSLFLLGLLALYVQGDWQRHE